MENFELLSVVALLKDEPGHELRRGQVGTVVEHLSEGVQEVEFCDAEGRTIALLPVRSGDLLLLHHDAGTRAA